MAKPEALSRVLIDQALKDSDWDLLDDRRVRFELDGNSGRADYVLLGDRGPLCVLEAKREDKDPYEAKDQARGYAENLRAPSRAANHALLSRQRVFCVPRASPGRAKKKTGTTPVG